MSPRTDKASEQTKISILQKAVELFNEHGTASVSMNALAESLGISAGNLQYHYKGKEDLIRAILEEMFRQFDGIYRSIEGTFTLDILRQTMRLHFHLVWKYRFFYREQGALLRNDETLADRFRAIQAQRMDEQEALMKRLAASGGLRGNLSPEELRNVVLIGWVLGNTLLAYNESLGQKIDEAAQAQALEIMIQHYKPYLLETK